jgi:hypothetical protein
LPDSTYDQELERLSGLAKYPALPKAQQELRHALRRITESDIEFLHRLISEVVDTHSICPTPSDLIQIAGAKRHRAQQSIGKPDCEECHGSGFVSFTRRVHVTGMDPYEADFSRPCACRGK